MIFMPPGSFVIEVVSEFSLVNMPICGYDNNIANLAGHHYYMYGYYSANETLNATDLAISSAEYFLNELTDPSLSQKVASHQYQN